MNVVETDLLEELGYQEHRADRKYWLGYHFGKPTYKATKASGNVKPNYVKLCLSYVDSYDLIISCGKEVATIEEITIRKALDVAKRYGYVGVQVLQKDAEGCWDAIKTIPIDDLGFI